MDQNSLSSFSISVYLLALLCHLYCCGQCLAAPLSEEEPYPSTIGKYSMSKLDESNNNANYIPTENYHDESSEIVQPSRLVSHNPQVNIFPIYEVR